MFLRSMETLLFFLLLSLWRCTVHKFRTEVVYLLSIWIPAFKDKKYKELIMNECRLFFGKLETLIKNYEKELK
jgi:hypothetical protein